MASKKNISNEILIKVDHNNLIYIDPNTVISDGNLLPRQVEAENLAIYVNLEADLVPRTTLISSDKTNQLFSIAEGTLNFLQNGNGQNYDTTWTDTFTNITEKKDNEGQPTGVHQYANSSQTFGIDNISIKIAGTNFVPQIQIKFIDIRGKTLFESPENSPYKAFFHLPWPIFYLTVKGYYGKAIRYRLHMVSFNSSYNSSNGNFEIDTTFVGSVYAFLTDIPLSGILNAPYMYGVERTPGETKFNSSTGYYEKVLKKTSLGYSILTSVYDEYKAKGLLPQNFPIKTLREIAVIARRLDKILENEIFNTVINPKILAAVKEYDESITMFFKEIKNWKDRNLSGSVVQYNGVDYYKLSSTKKNSDEIIKGSDTGTLFSLIKRNVEKLNANPAFGTNRDEQLVSGLSITPVSLTTLTQNLNEYYINNGTEFLVSYKLITDRISDAQQLYVEERNKLQDLLQKKMNEIIKKNSGFGFEPTIRNIFGVILANAETYIRLMKEIHRKAFNQDRKKELEGILTDSVGDEVFPWPEVKQKSVGTKQNVLMYPAEKTLISKLKSDTWPEIGFVEEFIQVATYKTDPLAEREGSLDYLTYIFDNDSEVKTREELTTFTKLTNVTPYYNKSISSVLYEIWERARMITLLESFDSGTIQELAKLEFQNIKNALADDVNTSSILKTKITSRASLEEMMRLYSQFERWPYFKSQIPTVSYISSALSTGFDLLKYVNSEDVKGFGDKYPKLKKNLLTYIPEGYRHNLYPFNSDIYKSYLPLDKSGREGLNLNGILEIRTNDSFISSPINGEMWIKEDYKENIFNNLINIDGIGKSILNTSYFHKQLYDDFTTQKTSGKYASSAYLFLNSLPFKDLNDTVKDGDKKDVLMSTMFKEIGATHFIPYHLILKWGSIYHRYKTYLIEGKDIIENVTVPIDTDLFFDYGENRSYIAEPDVIPPQVINRDLENNIGLYPFYQSVFHQIVQGYGFYNPFSGQTNTSYGPADYAQKVEQKVIIDYKNIQIGGNSWTSLIDNSKFDAEVSGYTLLPSNGNYQFHDINDYLKSEQDNFRILWDVEGKDNYVLNYSGQTFPSYNQYFKDIQNVYSLSSNNNKVIDLIAIFKPDILDTFERLFLEFSTERIEGTPPFDPPVDKYNNFQDLLKELVHIPKDQIDSTVTETLIDEITKKQNRKLKNISNYIIGSNNLLKFTLSNPKEIDPYHLFGFTRIDSEGYESTKFFESQVTNENLKYIQLYLGDDMDSYYIEFFRANDIALTEDNIKNLRFLIYIYAGARKGSLITANNTDFITYLKNNLINKSSVGKVVGNIVESSSGGISERMNNFLDILIRQFSSLTPVEEEWKIDIKEGYADDILKLELYNYFKSFNDKWVAGNSIGQRSLMEEFLFLDKANRDIGDEVYLSMDRIVSLLDQTSLNKVNLFSALNLLIKNSGFDIRPLPAYVNFYGATEPHTKKILPSKTVAKTLFGSFLEVDYQDSSPKILLQYVGPTSKYLQMEDIDRNRKFQNDTFDMGDTNNHPLIIEPDVFRNIDFSKSNKAVAFEVSFGDQNQSIFKGWELNQNSIKNTSESFEVLERLGNQETGSSTAQIDIGLFDIYRSASYTCTVSCMGNVMIQPTMYFYLKNVPLFRGSYWITEVNHNIRNNGIETSFIGTRIPIQSLPNPKDSFMASYRMLFDVLVNKAQIKSKLYDLYNIESENNEEFEDVNGVTHIYNPGPIKIGVYAGESLVKRDGITEYGIAYNGRDGERFVQLINVDGTKSSNVSNEWLRTRVIEMGGKSYYMESTEFMGFISLYNNESDEQTTVRWGEIENIKDKTNFYVARFKFQANNANNIIDKFPITEFYNPKNKRYISIRSNFDFTNKIFTGPVSIGPGRDIAPTAGIGLSTKLMRELGLNDDDIIYFRLIN